MGPHFLLPLPSCSVVVGWPLCCSVESGDGWPLCCVLTAQSVTKLGDPMFCYPCGEYQGPRPVAVGVGIPNLLVWVCG